MTCASATDDSVLVTSIAMSTTFHLECQICDEDCPGLPQMQPFLFPGHEVHTYNCRS